MSFSPITGAAPTVIHTPTEGLAHGAFKMPTFDGEISAYYAAPADQKNAPVLLVVQEVFGLHEHIQDVCRRFAKEGYFAVAVELYERQGDASKYSDIPTLIQEIVSKVSDEQVLADLDASVAWAKQQGADTRRLGITGFCWGGRITWMYAEHNPDCKAGVAWYGKLAVGHGPLQKRNPVDIAHTLKAPVLGLYGGQDAGIPLDDVHQMQDALAGGNEMAKASQIIVYPESNHAFYADYRPSYNEPDAKDAWIRALDWFKRYLA
ncbi:MAG: carboxymethylenebutenolidase [Pusillimonas sp.]|nr:carboxymethylenebutenolidase [Pusillimonas sp.]MBC43271.1 carboxymethylenebutenolidase [Pusillimonas sp.]HCP79319.1 carboxymethylenebutenolidase [Pusillimonas sp.]|tara:strand:+ start:84516 stop:85304 length:789 start_codon:yes stop_codon:yes gene_type:complete